MLQDIKNNNLFFRQFLFIGVLIALALIVFRQLHFFFGSFLGAFTLYVVLRGTMFKLTEKYRWKTWLASLCLVSITVVFLLCIGFLVFEVIYKEIPELDTSSIAADINGFIERVSKSLGFEIIPKNLIESFKGAIGKFAGSVLNTTYSFAANILMMILVLYFMLASGRKMERNIESYIPLKGDKLDLIKRETKNMIYSNAIGIPVIMFAQFTVSTLIYWILGINGCFFWGFVTAVCGLLPIVGSAIVFIPLAIYLILNGGIWGGIILALYGILIISNTDNLCRIVLMKKMSDTHPLIVIFGVIMGIPLFGFWGIIFGPLMISGFILLIKIYYLEYHPSE